MKKIDPEVLNCLKEALVSIYWYKPDLNTFLRGALTHTTLMGGINWTCDKKREAVDIVINRIAESPEKYQSDLMCLIASVCDMTEFEHLAHLEGGPEKVKRAKRSVELLKSRAGKVRTLLEEQTRESMRREKRDQEIATSSSFNETLKSLHKQFATISNMADSQAKGFQLEKLLRDLFELFDLDPRASFRIVGEQIDGAFTFDSTDYLLEAKWQKIPTGVSDLDSFSSKVKRKLENTLGLFVSMGGYSPDGISAHSRGDKVLIALEGAHLVAVLEGRLRMDDLLLRARRHAAQTGEVYLPLTEVF